jgi:hypothetical protein
VIGVFLVVVLSFRARVRRRLRCEVGVGHSNAVRIAEDLDQIGF